MNDTITPTPRAIKLTEDSVEVIANKGMDFDVPPSIDALLDAVLLPADYYFVTDCPSATSKTPITWAIVPDVIFEKRFRWATKPSKLSLISILEKE